MSTVALTRVCMKNGVWEGVLTWSRQQPPELRLLHQNNQAGEIKVAKTDQANRWFVSFRIPIDRLGDGVQTFIVEDATTGEPLTFESVVVGRHAEADLRAEIDVLKAELDLLKRSFRSHCAQSA